MQRSMIPIPLVSAAVAAVVSIACSSGSPSSSCSSIAGTWTFSGACGADVCVITQNGCATSLSCSGGAASYTGSVSGSDVSYSGKTSAGTAASCTGKLASDGTLSGTCTPTGMAACAFAGAKK